MRLFGDGSREVRQGREARAGDGNDSKAQSEEDFSRSIWIGFDRKLEQQFVTQGEVRPLLPKRRTHFIRRQAGQQFDERPRPGKVGRFLNGGQEPSRGSRPVLGIEHGDEVDVRGPGEIRVFEQRFGKLEITLDEVSHHFRQPQVPVLLGALLLSFEFAIEVQIAWAMRPVSSAVRAPGKRESTTKVVEVVGRVRSRCDMFHHLADQIRILVLQHS